VEQIMKLLGYILSVYIMTLVAIPCFDIHVENDCDHVEITHNMAENEHNNANHCSPFCLCECCPSPVLMKNNLMLYFGTPFVQKHITEFSSVYISSSLFSIWQPPKLI